MTPPIAAITAVHRIKLTWTFSRAWGWITTLGIGAGFAFAPDRYHSARGYRVADMYLTGVLHIGWHGAGWCFIASAVAILITGTLASYGRTQRTVLMATRARIAANVLAAFLYLLFEYSLFVALLNDSLDGFPALFLWPLAASVHLDASSQLARGLREDE